MHSTEFTKPVTTESLLSAFESRFGQTLNLEGLDKTQLEDMANMVRTKIHTITDNSHFGKELKDDNYQKHQSMLDIVNQAVKEATGLNTNLPPAQQAVVKKIQTTPGLKPQDKDQIIGAMVQKEDESPYTTDKAGAGFIMANKDKIIKQLYAGGVQSVLDPKDAVKAILDLIPDVTEQEIVDIIKKSEVNEYDTPEKKAERDALMKHYLAKGGTIEKLKPGIAKGASHIDTRGSLKKKEFPGIKFEGIEQQSELILAAKDMMDKVTGYLEDLASMKTEGMLQLADRIRDEMGAEKADAFVAKIQPALESAEATLTQTREDLDHGVRILTGEELESDTIGADDAMNTDAEAGLDELDTDLGVDDEFGAADASAGGTEPEGRAQRESREVFESSSRIYAKLAGK